MIYKAISGKVYVRGKDGKWTREVSTALTANGRDLEAFDRALAQARVQRSVEQ